MGIIGIVVTVIAAAVTIIASILGGMQWLMNKAKKSGANEHRLTNMEDTIQALECKKNYAELAAVSTRVEVVDRSLSDHKTAINDFNKKMTEILESVSYIKGVIDIRPLLKETELVQSNSPIALSDLGKKIAKQTQLTERIERNWIAIRKVLNEQNLQTPYDIDKYCFEMATLKPELFLTEEDINFMKDYSFKEGKSLQYYAAVVGVLVRDKYFQEKGIPLHEVDIHIEDNNI